MEFRQDRGPKSLLKKSFFLSGFIHLLLLGSLWFFFRSDSIQKASGIEGNEGTVYVSIVGASKVILAKAGIQMNSMDPRFRGDDRQDQRAEAFINDPGEGGEAGSSDILRQIRIKIERAKFYPLIAKRSHLEGSPEVELKIKQNGSLEYVTLKKSCGSKILDDAALATVTQAAPFPFYPEPIALNIAYSLTR